MVVMAGIGGSLLVGCAPSTSDQEIDLPPKNVDAWVMPLDQFTFTSGPLRDYAEALVERPCYAEHGIEWNVPWQPIDRGIGAGFSDGGQKLFTIDSAQKFGYHGTPNEWENKDAWRSFIEDNEKLANENPGFDDALTDCRTRSRDTLPLPSDEERDYASQASVQTYEEALLDERVLALVDDWQACMLDSGYPNVTENPELMPVDELAKEWQVGVPGTTATPAEVAMATADATCSESVGWDKALYDAQWERQSAFVETNADRLIRIRAEIDKERQMLEKAVAENAPAT